MPSSPISALKMTVLSNRKGNVASGGGTGDGDGNGASKKVSKCQDSGHSFNYIPLQIKQTDSSGGCGKVRLSLTNFPYTQSSHPLQITKAPNMDILCDTLKYLPNTDVVKGGV